MSNSTESQIKAILNSSSFETACANFAVANTPLFLLRKLQGDPVVERLGELLSPSDLVEAIRLAVAKQPENVRDIVVPYALLAALGAKADFAEMENASQISPKFHNWYNYLVEVLQNRAVPTSRVKFDLSSQQSISRLLLVENTDSFEQTDDQE